jgi:energy-converting hydrogenase Eha subunit E
MTFTAQQSRVDALIRLLGLVVLVFGASLLYYTYSNAYLTSIAPQIITVNYTLGALLAVVGLFAAFSKFK